MLNFAKAAAVLIFMVAMWGAGFAQCALKWSATNKAQQTAIVCFDGQDRPTLSSDWRECRLVHIREARS